MKKQHKKYKRPRKLFDKHRIEEENVLIKRYGLKNKKGLWKAEAYISKIRNQAKKLITASIEEQEKFIEKLVNIGLLSPDSKIDDSLALTKENILNRRLQTIVQKQGFATAPKQARQLITHRHITVEGNIVDVPSYVVSVILENKIKLRKKKTKPKPKAIPAEKPAEPAEKPAEPAEKPAESPVKEKK